MNMFGGFLKPDEGTKIFIFDEAQQITPAAQELLNKVLEEPPKHVMIFLCTTNKKGLKRTLLGRCSKLTFRRVTRKQADDIIEQVTTDAGVDLPAADVVDDLFMRADGSVRDLLNYLDKVLVGSYNIGSDTADVVVNEGSPDIFALVKGLVEKNWPVVRDILKTENVKNDPDGYRETVCAFLARDALKFDDVRMSIATVLGHLSGSLWEEPKREQHSILVTRCMRACYKKVN